MSKKFREFWISKELTYVEIGPGGPSPLMKERDGGRFVHVIEYAAYDQLKQDLEACIEALAIARNQLEGCSIAIKKHGTNINPIFFIDYYHECAMAAEQTLSKLKYKKEM